MAQILAISISEKKGEKKRNIPEAQVLPNHGLAGDAHTGTWHRQISLLAIESIAKMRERGIDVHPGDFAENITTEGIDLLGLPLGSRLRLGDEVLLEVTQHGKECHHGCAIYRQVGDCVMPREGIFARVLQGGTIRPGDPIERVQLITVGIVTASDKGAQGQRNDVSGERIRELVANIDGQVLQREIVPDEQELLSAKLQEMAESRCFDLIFTTGGTGFGPRDVTPEATKAVIEREVPGIPEEMRRVGRANTPRAMLSRAVAGIRGQTLIINLPGSPKGVEESLGAILGELPHAIEILRGQGGECAR
ncbi:MAG: molybdenum cofactor synthesis domain-containing protein [Limnochordia bacterium]|jgi:molybdopterin adenylyltransferase